MQLLFYYYWFYSGILLIVYTWLLLVLPYLVGTRMGKYKKKATFSDIVALPKYKLLMTPAIILIGLTQVFFLDFMLHKFQIALWPNGILYFFSSFSLVLSGFYDSVRFPTMHKYVSVLYFLLSSTGALVISLYVNLVAVFFMSILAVGFFYFFLRKKYVWAELYFSLLSSLWGLVIYLA